MITQDEAIALAREVGCPVRGHYDETGATPDELTALCNAVRKQTLLEAADEVDDGEYDHKWKAEELRRMAGVE